MRLTDLVSSDPSSAAPIQARDPLIAGLTSDSRAVEPGWLFAALPGTKADGRAFVADAVRRGAVAVLGPVGTAAPDGIAVIEDENPRLRLALLAARFFGRQPATVAAVTGTNGKTSTVQFARQLWALLGHKAAQPRHARHHGAGDGPLRLADHAGHGIAAPGAGGTGGCRDRPSGDGSVEPRARPVSPGRREGRGRRFHKFVTGPPGLPRQYAGIPRGQGDAVRPCAAPGRRRGPQRRHARIHPSVRAVRPAWSSPDRLWRPGEGTCLG